VVAASAPVGVKNDTHIHTHAVPRHTQSPVLQKAFTNLGGLMCDDSVIAMHYLF
jgi:hypothetical protein